MNRNLADFLVCPESKLPLSPADEKLLAEINARITSGNLKDKSGEKPAEKLTAALVEPRKRVLYRVEKDIPVLLAEKGIPY